MIIESKIFEEDDKKVKARVDAKNELESYVFSEAHLLLRYHEYVFSFEGIPIR
jgi:hypothetical protein